MKQGRQEATFGLQIGFSLNEEIVVSGYSTWKLLLVLIKFITWFESCYEISFYQLNGFEFYQSFDQISLYMNWPIVHYMPKVEF